MDYVDKLPPSHWYIVTPPPWPIFRPPLTGRGLQQMVKLYADFETGLIGVGKTADLSGAELESLGKDIDELSKRMPVATDELLAIAQSAGQLGVKGSDNILKFTETVAKLGTATDLSGDQAAMALARILNVTGEALGTVDVLGSVIVALGNNFAATESQIVDRRGILTPLVG